MLMLCFSVEKQTCHAFQWKSKAAMLLLYFSVEEQVACSLLVVALHWQNDIGMAAQNKPQEKERHVKN
jgi:hypothetical protein